MLAELLRKASVTRLFVGRLATDYCERNSTIDALQEGLRVVLLTGALRRMKLQAGDDVARLRNARPRCR